jgi:hypothetical protein
MVYTQPDHRTDAIQSLDALRDSLASNGIELAQWGIGDAKTVESLWTEMLSGETYLQADPLCRVLAGVVQVIIRRYDGRILIEEEQVLSDGRRRHRDIPPSEKMLPGESYQDTALRCLKEELHLNPVRARILPETHAMRQELRSSWSYPGLRSLYTIHRVEVRAPEVLTHNFRTSEVNNPGEGFVKEHLWAWKLPPPELR